jgi:hypothetical protein
MNGYCIVIDVTPQCKCYYGYLGDICDKESGAKKKVSYFQYGSIIICVVVIVTTCVLILSNDILSYFGIGSRKKNLKKNKQKHFKNIRI